MKTRPFPTAKPANPRVPKSPAAKLKHYFPQFVAWRQACDCSGLILPMPPNMANSRMHWRSKDAARQTYFGHCDTLRTLGLLPEPPRVAPTHATIEARLVLMREMDADGAMSRLKWAVDWLVTRGYLEDDKPSHLSWRGVPEQAIKGKGEPQRVFIWLEAGVEAQRGAL